MKETYIINQDKQFMKLRDQVFKLIPAGKDYGKKWRAFREYMNFYYKRIPSIHE